MTKYLDISSWNRKEHFNHFKNLKDPNFGVVVNVDVTKTYLSSKKNKESFFVRYLHACMIAINSVENFKYRLEGDKIAVHNTIHASATIARPDTTFAFSYILFSEDYKVFEENFKKEKSRIWSTTNLFPPSYSPACIHCSALPWMSFTSHKEPFSGNKTESIPQLAFGKTIKLANKMEMPVAITVNHALVDGYHVGLFFEEFQKALNNVDL